MQELSIQQCDNISGGNHKPDVGTLLIAVSLGALWNDGYQISKDYPN